MRFDRRNTGRYLSSEVRFCSDDFYESIAAVIIHSGVVAGDVEFLKSSWCEQLLDFLGSSMTGMEIFEKYQARQQVREDGVNRGKR